MEFCPKIHPLPHKIHHIASCLKQPIKKCDGHSLHRALPFLSRHCQAAAHIFRQLPEASIHLLTAVNTKRSSSKPGNPDQENRWPGLVAGAAASEDRRTHIRQTDGSTIRQHPLLPVSEEGKPAAPGHHSFTRDRQQIIRDSASLKPAGLM